MAAARTTSSSMCDADGASAERLVVLVGVTLDGLTLRHAGAELRGDGEIVLEAVKNNPYALKYAVERLKADREIVLESVKQDGTMLEFVAEELRADREIVLEAVKQCGLALRDAAVEVQADHEVVLAAVSQDPRSLEYAAEEIRGSTRLVQLIGEQHRREFLVRCIGLCGLELTVVHFELDSVADVLASRVKEALPPGLGRLTLVLPDGTILQPPGLGPLDLQLLDGTIIEGSTFTPLSVQELFGFWNTANEKDGDHIQVPRKRRRSYSASPVRQPAEANGL